MVNLEKYKNDGWGLSRKEFELLYDFLSKNNDRELNIVEFGSGISTEFLIDFNTIHSSRFKIYSFDDSIEYAYKGHDENLLLSIISLVDTDDNTFESMFINKKYDESKMRDKLTPSHTRQKNTFYKINESMLPETIDLVIVDGPHGNGRSLAFLHCFNRFKDGTFVLIDDASHYPFYEHLKMLCNTEIVYEQHIREDKWNNGGDFILCKILK